MNTDTRFPDATTDGWCGDATSVVEFLRPLRHHLDAPDVLEVCFNRPGELMVETTKGWSAMAAPEMSQERCMSLATAVATYGDQQINQERPLLSATLPSGERVQFVIPPAVPRGTVSITIRKPSSVIKGLQQFEQEGLFERAQSVVPGAAGDLAPHEAELLALRNGGRYADFLRLTLPNHPNVVHLFYSKDAQGTARVTAKSLLEACLRMKPDRIFLAEVRGDECFHFVRLAASGHPGSITSVHAGSCALAFEQMALMIRETSAGSGLRMDEIKRLLRIVIDVVVQFDRDERGRFISEILYEPRGQRLGRQVATAEAST
ncbi:MAG: Flp pilus assembly complex ATPase component TadA [Burkholderiales bacterium]|nr:Flp pilus assembly complex ATPase component TadA [Burkholderiales bacterium]